MSIGSTHIEDKVDVIDGYHDVTTADSTDDVVIRDVVGRKTDTANATVGTGSSLMRYIKGLIGLHGVTTADATTDANIRDVVGRKTDTANTTVGDTSSLMRYSKGILNKENVSTLSATTTGVIVEDGTDGTCNLVTVTSSATANTLGAWAEIDASASADSWICSIFLHCVSNVAALGQVFELGTGAAASEATKTRHSCNISRPNVGDYFGPITFALPIPIKVVSGTRIAARVADVTASAIAYQISVQMYQSLET